MCSKIRHAEVETMAFRDYLRMHVERIEAVLPSYIEHSEAPEQLIESMRYSLMAGGKRLRPIMTLMATEAVRGCVEHALPTACAIEMIHTYSLIHDDLPAMDNDDFRRGKPTNHKLYGEAMAILAGDGLLTRAFGVIAEEDSAIPAEIRLKLCAELAKYAGPVGMVGGQAADMLGEQKQLDLPSLEYVHTHKTGDLIVFSLRAGGWIGGGNVQQINALDSFGRKLGLAFQIQDDILDEIGDTNKLGKSAGSDRKQEKSTYTSLLGIEQCRKMVISLTTEAKEALQLGHIPSPQRLIELADYLMDRDH